MYRPQFIVKKIIVFHLLFLFSLFAVVRAENSDRYDILRDKLVELSSSSVGLGENVEISVTGVSIQSFLRGLAEIHNLNISVDPKLDITVVNRFSNEKVSNIFLFLCKKHDLDIQFIGSILSFVPYKPPPVIPVKNKPRKIPIEYDKSQNTITLDLRNDSLVKVSRKLTKMTGRNIVLSHGLQGKRINGYLQNISLEDGLDKLAFANDLVIRKSEDGVYLIEEKEDQKNQKGHNTRRNRKGGYQSDEFTDLFIKTTYDSLGSELITIDAINASIIDVIKQAAKELDKSYFLYADITGQTSSRVEDIGFDELLNYLLHNTNYTYKKQDGIYLIGDRNLAGLRTTRVVQLQHRSGDIIIDVIPARLKNDLELKSFPELNSVILSGSVQQIDEVEAFIKSLDKTVPMIMIEVMVVDVTKGRTTDVGLKAGIADSVKGGGSILPGLDFTVSTSALNDLLTQMEGFGVVNLGKVKPNFYVNLKALEAQRNINIRSTPKLATLNGNTANMRIGQTQYYLVTKSNIIGTQNPQTVVTQEYKEAKADLAINIRPLVSRDDHVTLDLVVEMSNFIGAPPANSPPATATRQFESIIRVKNEEMIMLGGLEETEQSNNSSGVPFLSRIPVLKWIFSSRSKTKRTSKLNIFIKPTIVYS